MDKKYTIEVKCKNCGAVFTKEIAFGVSRPEKMICINCGNNASTGIYHPKTLNLNEYY